MFVSFADLPVFNQTRAKEFYVDKFGCEVIADVAMGNGDWRWVEVRFPGAQTAIHFVRRQDEAPSQRPVMVFMAEDPPSTVRELASKGVAIVKDVGPAPWNPQMKAAEVDDSEGNRIVIMTR
jgi:predicted enzyme related to lactoylglutathione lyase